MLRVLIGGLEQLFPPFHGFHIWPGAPCGAIPNDLVEAFGSPARELGQLRLALEIGQPDKRPPAATGTCQGGGAPQIPSLVVWPRLPNVAALCRGGS